MIGVGIVGYGAVAKVFHQPLIKACSKIKLRAVYSSKANPCGLPSDVEIEHDLEKFISRGDVDLVVVATPNEMHFPIAKAALSAGKHVVLEKPMVLTVEQGVALKELAQKCGRILTVFHNRRLDGDFLTVAKLIKENVLGDIKVFTSCWNRYNPKVRDRWREKDIPGSGIWYDLGPHLVDQALMLFGKPNSVEGTLLSMRKNSQTTDYAQAMLHYDKLEVILKISPFYAAPLRRFCIEGEKGTFVKYGLDVQEAQLKAGLDASSDEFGVAPADSYGELYYGDGRKKIIPTMRAQFTTYYDNLADAINGKTKSAVSVDEALDVMQILENVQSQSK